MIFAKEPYILHLLAGSTSIQALDAAKTLLDSGSHLADEREPVDNLSPLHIAAAWDNLAFCQLLLHYGADIRSVDIDNRRPVDVATGKSRKFLRKLKKKSLRERLHLDKIFAFIFGRASSNNTSTHQSKDIKETSVIMRRSCPTVLKTAPALPIMSSSFIHDISNRPSNVQIQRPEKRDASTSTYQTADENRSPEAGSSSDHNPYLTRDNTLEDLEEDVPIKELDVKELDLQKEFAKLNINALRDKLKTRNCPAGPLDGNNRRLYERKLARLEIMAGSGKDAPGKKYSAPLRLVIMDDENCTNDTTNMGEPQEQELRSQFLQSMGKNQVSFFCYLLIDPSVIPDPSTCNLRSFIAAIFYVGKGKRSRPLQHLKDANKCRSLVGKKNFEPTAKLKRILKLWDRGDGVISLHLWHNIHSAESFIREGAMIEAIGIENLTNIQRGNLKSLPTVWPHRKIEEFGAMLLRKAHVIFRNERCRPVFENDVAS
ncbi:ankyrin repeat and LEM domain-containing protein 1 [Ditylenchus destructor]|nr:ankyrin repeat and LEM domain-containing protein 1 [Ditylenchus destructor]